MSNFSKMIFFLHLFYLTESRDYHKPFFPVCLPKIKFVIHTISNRPIITENVLEIFQLHHDFQSSVSVLLRFLCSNKNSIKLKLQQPYFVTD